MEVEIFETELEFMLKYPSGLFRCSNCQQVTNNSTECQYCGWRADGLLKTWGKGYKFKILDTKREYEIFKPIEKEINDDKGTIDKGTT